MGRMPLRKWDHSNGTITPLISRLLFFPAGHVLSSAPENASPRWAGVGIATGTSRGTSAGRASSRVGSPPARRAGLPPDGHRQGGREVGSPPARRAGRRDASGRRGRLPGGVVAAAGRIPAWIFFMDASSAPCDTGGMPARQFDGVPRLRNKIVRRRLRRGRHRSA